MASRRDQLQSHQFMAQRVIAAFVVRETDPPQAPLRRGIGAVFTGVMVSVMIAAGFGVYGLLTKVGSDAWRTNGAVVIESETGAPYVYQDGVLHPMLNFTSALLAGGSAPRAVYRESAATISAVPRGVLLGIPGAPTSLPDAGQAVAAPWRLCTRPASPDRPDAPVTELLVGGSAGAATALGDRGVLVSASAGGDSFLIWHGTRFAVAAPIAAALFGVVTPVAVGAAWLNGVPQGPDIVPVHVPAAGTPSAAAPAYAVGQVLATPIGTGGTQYWLVLDDGLAPLTELQKDLVVSQGGAAPVKVTAAAATAIHRSDPPGPPGLPGAPPQLAAAPGGVCATFAADGTATVTLGGASTSAGTPTPGRTAAGALLADRVAVPAGHVAVVRVMNSASASGPGYFLVTDLGVRYAVASDEVLARLGYPPSAAVGVPAALVALIPAGPALDPAVATRPAG